MPAPGKPRPPVPATAGLQLAGAMLAWLGGNAWQLQQAALWPAPAYGLLLAAALLGGIIGRRVVPPRPASRRPGARLLLAGAAIAAAAFAATGLRAGWRLADRLPAALEGADLVLTGTVVGLPQPGPDGVRFRLEVEHGTRGGAPVALPRRVSLSWTRGFDGDVLIAGPAAAVEAGQRWQLPVRLKQPHGTANPHGFDLELWLFEQRIGATGTVRATAGAGPRLLAAAAGRPIDRARQHIRDAILLHVPDAGSAGVLAALAVGDQAAIGRDDWETFRRTGVAHLMSISGLHVTMFAWLAGGLAGWAWRRSGRLMLALPAPTAARWCGVLAATGYALLAGWGVPAQRTVLMLALIAALRSAGLRWPPLLVLLAAAAGVSAFDPWALLQPGFWLSFAAVALLMLTEAPPATGPADRGWRQRLAHAARAGLRTQVVASVGLAPLTLVFFQQVSVVGFGANLVAIPLVTLLVTPLALLGVLLPPLWSAAAWVVAGLDRLLAALAALPWATLGAPAAPPWAVALGLAGLAVLLLPLPGRQRVLGLPMLLPLLLPAPLPPAAGGFEVVVADVGQGSAVLVRTRSHLLVYDAGPRYGPEADAGGRVLLPLLRARGEARVDRLVLSHRDADHVGGAAALLAGVEVASIASSLEPAHPLRRAGVPHEACAAGAGWQWDGVDFDWLHPLPGAAASAPNALSCVLRVRTADGRSLLLAGDIEAAQEAALVARAGRGLRAQVLLVPHHGSRTSSSAAFVEAVAPGTALVQAGYRNRFGHPAAEVEARYRALGIELLRADRCGAWTWTAQGSTRCEREAGARYWHHRPEDGGTP